MASSWFGEGVNVPLPSVDHTPPLPALTRPLSCTASVCTHTDWLDPATEAGCLLKDILRLSDTTEQLSLLVEVRISSTEPAVVSAALGTYLAFSTFNDGENIPVPRVDHTPVVVP